MHCLWAIRAGCGGRPNLFRESSSEAENSTDEEGGGEWWVREQHSCAGDHVHPVRADGGSEGWREEVTPQSPSEEHNLWGSVRPEVEFGPVNLSVLFERT